LIVRKQSQKSTRTQKSGYYRIYLTANALRNFSAVIPTMTCLVLYQGPDLSLPRVFCPKSVMTGIALATAHKLCSAWLAPRR
jgi:hypothetical protein